MLSAWCGRFQSKRFVTNLRVCADLTMAGLSMGSRSSRELLRNFSSGFRAPHLGGSSSPPQNPVESSLALQLVHGVFAPDAQAALHPAETMRQLNRLLRYLKPYWLHILASVLAMALVGVLEAFRLLLIGPIFDRVLNPSSHGRDLPSVPHAHHQPADPVGLVRSRSTFTTSGRWWPSRWSPPRC